MIGMHQHGTFGRLGSRRRALCVAAAALSLCATLGMVGCGGQDAQSTSSSQAESATQQEQDSQQASSAEQEAYVTAYTLEDLPLRAQADKNADKLETVPVGTELKVSSMDDEWAATTYKDATGFVSTEFLTEDAEEAQFAKEEKEDELAEKAEAAAKAAASSDSKERSVVSKEKCPNCDNPEHGYYEILYSDGTYETEEY